MDPGEDPMGNETSGNEASPRGGALAYSVLTLVAAGVAVALIGGTPERRLGIAAAWLIQAVAFRRLDGALAARRDATRAWVTGIALRAGGLGVAALLVVAGRASADLPVAYGIAMLVLLLAEAGWLARDLSRTAGRGASEELDRTHSTG